MKNPTKRLAALRKGNPDADFDYIDKLSPQDQEWLAQFGCELYNGNRFENQLHNQEQMREIWRRRKRVEKDALYMRHLRVGFFEVDESNDDAPTDPQEF